MSQISVASYRARHASTVAAPPSRTGYTPRHRKPGQSLLGLADSSGGAFLTLFAASALAPAKAFAPERFR